MVLSPHVAGVTGVAGVARETRVRIAPAAVRTAGAFVDGKPPRDVVS
jgi:hypothetical protein